MNSIVKILVFSFAFICLRAEDVDINITSYEIRIGTLEVHKDVKSRYVFRWEGKEEVFNMTTGVESNDSVRPPGLPDQSEIGFCTKRGEVHEYGNLTKLAYLQKFSAEHPEEEIEALVFKGINNNRIEISLKEKTPLCRVDIRLGIGRDVTLWSNLPSEKSVKRELNPNSEVKK